MATLAPSFFFGSSLFLEVTKTFIISWMSSNFKQIRPLTAELSALECLKNQYFVFLEVTKTSMISWVSSNFKQIQPLTAELSALECLKNQYCVLWPL